MKKNSTIVIGIIIVLIVAVGGYAVFHKSPKKPTASTSITPPTTNNPMANSAVITTKTNSSVGQYLVDTSGNALYTYGADNTGVSNCTGSCLANWPAYQDTGSTTGLPTNVGTFKRTDNGDIQYTYKGMPLYTFVGDSQGQVTGNNVENFQVAKP